MFDELALGDPNYYCAVFAYSPFFASSPFSPVVLVHLAFSPIAWRLKSDAAGLDEASANRFGS